MHSQPDPGSPILEIRNLTTYFPIRKGILSRTVGFVRAVDDVSLTVERGQTLGLVGESGCGKTTLGRTVVRLERATAGQVLFEGEDLLALPPRRVKAVRPRIQMIFQDPHTSLNPRMTIRDIVTEGLLQHRRIEGSRQEAAERWLRVVGMDADALHRYPHEFSGGQQQRINIARAVSMRPDFIICDEPVSALDVSVQAQVINLLMDLADEYRISYLFISHDLSVVKIVSQRVAVMYLGEIVEIGASRDVIERPLHPYTQALVSAIPVPGRDRKKRIVLKGDIPSAANPPPGCRFHTRCPRVMDRCRVEWPEGRSSAGRAVRCHLY